MTENSNSSTKHEKKMSKYPTDQRCRPRFTLFTCLTALFSHTTHTRGWPKGITRLQGEFRKIFWMDAIGFGGPDKHRDTHNALDPTRQGLKFAEETVVIRLTKFLWKKKTSANEWKPQTARRHTKCILHGESVMRDDLNGDIDSSCGRRSLVSTPCSLGYQYELFLR